MSVHITETGYSVEQYIKPPSTRVQVGLFALHLMQVANKQDANQTPVVTEDTLALTVQAAQTFIAESLDPIGHYKTHAQASVRSIASIVVNQEKSEQIIEEVGGVHADFITAIQLFEDPQQVAQALQESDPISITDEVFATIKQELFGDIEQDQGCLENGAIIFQAESKGKKMSSKTVTETIGKDIAESGLAFPASLGAVQKIYPDILEWFNRFDIKIHKKSGSIKITQQQLETALRKAVISGKTKRGEVNVNE